METAINLKWHSFAQNLGASSSILRHKNMFTDVTLAAEDQQVEAHKFILSTCSPFFNNILLKNCHAHPLIYLKGVRFCDLTSLLDFMYCGEVNIQQKDLDFLLSAADDLQVKGLTENSYEGDQSKEAVEEETSDPSKNSSSLADTDITVKPKSISNLSTGQKKDIQDGTVEYFLNKIDKTPKSSAGTSLNSSIENSFEVVEPASKKRKYDTFVEPAFHGRKRSRADFSVNRPRQSLTSQETPVPEVSGKSRSKETGKQVKVPGRKQNERVSESKENDPSDKTIAGIEELLKLSHRVLAESDENTPQESSKQKECADITPNKAYRAKELIQKSPAQAGASPRSYKNATFKSSTPAKSPQDKTKAMIDLMLVKKNGVWRCSICNKTWPLNVKQEAEFHIGTVHMKNGNLVK